MQRNPQKLTEIEPYLEKIVYNGQQFQFITELERVPQAISYLY